MEPGAPKRQGTLGTTDRACRKCAKEHSGLRSSRISAQGTGFPAGRGWTWARTEEQLPDSGCGMWTGGRGEEEGLTEGVGDRRAGPSRLPRCLGSQLSTTIPDTGLEQILGVFFLILT